MESEFVVGFIVILFRIFVAYKNRVFHLYFVNTFQLSFLSIMPQQLHRGPYLERARWLLVRRSTAC